MDSLSTPKVLLLGISYPDVKVHMAKHDYDDSILQNSEHSVEQAVECVRRKILTEMDGRDLARCIATEQAGGGHEVYTVSKEMGGIYRSDRHVYASFNNSRSMRKAMAKAFGQIQFQQVILDYYWMPTGWLVTRWAKTLFQETLPDLVKHNMLAYPGSRQRSSRKSKAKTSNVRKKNDEKKEMKLEEGVVFLPFCAHVCKELVGGIDILEKYYAITFVKKSELPGHVLWKGTMNIDGQVMQHRLGKRLDQEEIYCTFQPKDIYESMEDAHVAKDEVMKMLLSIEDFANIRMIRLRPLRQHEPPSVFKKAIAEPEVGGFIGLNWEKGQKLFKEFRGRGKNKQPTPVPSPPSSPPELKQKRPKTTRKKKKEVAVTDDSGSEVHTESSDFEDSCCEIDTESDSSSDEESVYRGQKSFDPLDRKSIPLITHFYPYPALDMESYTNVKEIVDDDRVMTSWARTWGPKSSRKKNRKQDISKNDYQRFREKQRDYLSRNSRLPDRQVEHEDGYKWTLADDVKVGEEEDDKSEKGNVRIFYHAVRGWKRILKGDDPDKARIPKILELAKRDKEMTACRQLFEMKNPGLKTYSRAWLDNPFLNCYQIPQHSVLAKMDLREKTEEKVEHDCTTSIKVSSEYAKYHQYDSDDDCDVLSDSGSVDDREGNVTEEQAIDCALSSSPTSTPSKLFQFANIVASAPALSDDFLALCKGSKGLLHGESEIELPPFKPKLIPKPLDYNLNPHKKFPRELFRLLQDAEEKVISHIICWQEKGRSFIVNHHELFQTVVLRACCEDSYCNYKSFLKNITSYGFTEIQVGKCKGGYRHNMFQRGKPKRLDLLVKRFETITNDWGVDKSLKSKEIGDEPIKFITRSPDFLQKRASRKQFIENLHEFLCKSTSLGFGNAIHWEEHGTSFKVHRLEEAFTKTVLKDFFFLDQYSRFKQELMDRGFKCKEGKKYGVFEHPSFTQSQRNVLDATFEIKLKKRKMKTDYEKDDNPGKRKRSRKTELEPTSIDASPKIRSRKKPSMEQNPPVSDYLSSKGVNICSIDASRKIRTRDQRLSKKTSCVGRNLLPKRATTCNIDTAARKTLSREKTPSKKTLLVSKLSPKEANTRSIDASRKTRLHEKTPSKKTLDVSKSPSTQEDIDATRQIRSRGKSSAGKISYARKSPSAEELATCNFDASRQIRSREKPSAEKVSHVIKSPCTKGATTFSADASQQIRLLEKPPSEKNSNVSSTLSSKKWTPEEHQSFLEGYKELGRRWTNIAKRIPTRSLSQVVRHAKKHNVILSTIELPNGKTTRTNSDNQRKTSLPKESPAINKEKQYSISRGRNFPKVLNEILENSEKEGFSGYIRWSSQGDSFLIEDKSLFVKNFLQKHTNLAKFPTFERALKCFGFQNIDCKNPANRKYRHENFTRGNVRGIKLMKSMNPNVVLPRSKKTMSTTVHETRLSEPGHKKRKMATPPSVESREGKKSRSDNPSNVSGVLGSPSSESKAPFMSTDKGNEHLHGLPGSGIITPIHSETPVESPITDSDKCTDEDDSEKSAPTSDAESEPQLRNSSNDITCKAAAGEGKKHIEKMNGTQKSCERSGVRMHAVENNHNLVATKSDIVPEEYGQPMSSNERSLRNGVQEKSNEDNNVSPAQRKGRRSRNKVCHINTSPLDISTLETKTIKSRHIAKTLGSRSQRKRSSATNPSLLNNGCTQTFEMNEMSSCVPHSLFDPDPRIGCQMNFSRSPEVANQSNRIMGMTECLEWTPITQIEQKKSAQDARKDPIQSEPRDILDERLRRIGLSRRACFVIVSTFSSKKGGARASFLKDVIYYRADLSTGADSELSLLAEFLVVQRKPEITARSGVRDLCDFLLECLLLETCSLEIRMSHGQHWVRMLFSQITTNPSKRILFHKILLKTCRDSAAELMQIRSDIMDALMQHESQKGVRLEWFGQKLKYKERELERSLCKLREEIHRSKSNDIQEVKPLPSFDNKDDSNNTLSRSNFFVRNDGCKNDMAGIGVSNIEPALGSFVSGRRSDFHVNLTNAEYQRNTAELALPFSREEPKNPEMVIMEPHCAFSPARAEPNHLELERTEQHRAFPPARRDPMNLDMKMFELQPELTNARAENNNSILEPTMVNLPGMGHTPMAFSDTNTEDIIHYPHF